MGLVVLANSSVTYRVSDPFCQNPEKNRVPNWPPQKNGSVQDLPPAKKWQSPTLVNLRVASPRLCHFLGVASLGLCFFFWILDPTPCSLEDVSLQRRPISDQKAIKVC